jgi:hypothetical protein
MSAIDQEADQLILEEGIAPRDRIVAVLLGVSDSRRLAVGACSGAVLQGSRGAIPPLRPSSLQDSFDDKRCATSDHSCITHT